LVPVNFSVLEKLGEEDDGKTVPVQVRHLLVEISHRSRGGFGTFIGNKVIHQGYHGMTTRPADNLLEGIHILVHNLPGVDTVPGTGFIGINVEYHFLTPACPGADITRLADILNHLIVAFVIRI